MPAASPTDSEPALAAPERILGEEDARAYRRYLEWSVGYGFKMAIVTDIGSAVAMDKEFAKKLLAAEGLPVGPYAVVRAGASVMRPYVAPVAAVVSKRLATKAACFSWQRKADDGEAGGTSKDGAAKRCLAVPRPGATTELH